MGARAVEQQRQRKRLFVSAAVPNPANWRIVHNRPRYMLGYHATGERILARQADLLVRRQVIARVERTIGSPLNVVNGTERSVVAA